MSIDKVETVQIQIPSGKQPRQDLPLIDAQEIKAILYLGLRGTVSLPIEKHEVDILA